MKRSIMGWKYPMLVLGLALLAVLVMDFNSRMAELRRLTAQKEVVSARATALVMTEMHLQEQIAYATSESAVERWAYESGHLVRPGDNPVVPVAVSQATPTPTPEPVAFQEPVPNWQRWADLFFGPSSP